MLLRFLTIAKGFLETHLVLVNCFLYTFANLEPSEVDNEALIILLINGTVEFRAWSPNSLNFATIQKHQNCNSPYGTCADNTWHHLSFSHNQFRVRFYQKFSLISSPFRKNDSSLI